jgi:two-component system, OmpR family, alkaline phosphatase synthesis response regulator PhoP
LPKILIADDLAFVRFLMQEILSGFAAKGVKILTAADGEAAVDIIAAERPDLVFLDAFMPKMDGLLVCNTVKNVLGIRDTRIVMMTMIGAGGPPPVAGGPDLYIRKPIDAVEVVRTAERVLRISPEP